MSQVEVVDFRDARRRVETQADAPVEVRQRAFACWVSLFDFANDELLIEMSALALSELLGVSRVTWIHYRGVLVGAGLLLVVTGSRGPHPQLLRLTPPLTR